MLLLLVDLLLMYQFRLRSLLIVNKQYTEQNPIYEPSLFLNSRTLIGPV